MKKHVLLFTLLALAMIVAACGKAEPAGPPEVVEATFARGLSAQMEPVNPGSEFEPDQTVYLSVKLKGNPKEGVVSARFFYQRRRDHPGQPRSGAVARRGTGDRPGRQHPGGVHAQPR